MVNNILFALVGFLIVVVSYWITYQRFKELRLLKQYMKWTEELVNILYKWSELVKNYDGGVEISINRSAVIKSSNLLNLKNNDNKKINRKGNKKQKNGNTGNKIVSS